MRLFFNKTTKPKKKKPKRKQKRRYLEEHNFDKDLTDIEFFDIMDDD